MPVLVRSSSISLLKNNLNELSYKGEDKILKTHNERKRLLKKKKRQRSYKSYSLSNLFISLCIFLRCLKIKLFKTECTVICPFCPSVQTHSSSHISCLWLMIPSSSQRSGAVLSLHANCPGLTSHRILVIPSLGSLLNLFPSLHLQVCLLDQVLRNFHNSLICKIEIKVSFSKCYWRPD